MASSSCSSATLPRAPARCAFERWHADLDRIEREAEQLKTPASYASGAYTLREHIGRVRRGVMAKAGAAKAFTG